MTDGLITETIENLDSGADQLIKFNSKIPLGLKVTVFVDGVVWTTTEPTIQLQFSYEKTAGFIGTVAAKNVSTSPATDILSQDKGDGLFVAVNYVESTNGTDGELFKVVLLAQKER